MTTLDCMKGSPCPHQPTEVTRALALNLHAVGVKHDEIARRLNISDETLRKYYKKELEEGLQDINVDVMNILLQRIKEEKDIGACFRWLKIKAGWYEAKAPEDVESVKEFAMDLLRAKSKNESE